MNKLRIASPLLIALLSIAVLLLSSACGWQLRGVDSREASSASEQEELSKKVTKATASSQSAATKNAPANQISEQNVEAEKTPASATKSSDTSGLRLIMQQRNHGLATAIQRKAWENKIDFSDSGRTLLIVENEKLDKRPLTVNETGVAAQYQLILTITFSQKNANGEVINPSQQIVSWRSYDFDAKLIVAKAQEEEALIVEMREELAQRMLTLLQK